VGYRAIDLAALLDNHITRILHRRHVDLASVTRVGSSRLPRLVTMGGQDERKSLRKNQTPIPSENALVHLKFREMDCVFHLQPNWHLDPEIRDST